MLIRPQLVLMTVVVALSSRTGLGHPNEADAVGEALPVLKIPATTPSDAENPGRQNEGFRKIFTNGMRTTSQR